MYTLQSIYRRFNLTDDLDYFYVFAHVLKKNDNDWWLIISLSDIELSLEYFGGKYKLLDRYLIEDHNGKLIALDHLTYPRHLFTHYFNSILLTKLQFFIYAFTR